MLLDEKQPFVFRINNKNDIHCISACFITANYPMQIHLPGKENENETS